MKETVYNVKTNGKSLCIYIYIYILLGSRRLPTTPRIRRPRCRSGRSATPRTGRGRRASRICFVRMQYCVDLTYYLCFLPSLKQHTTKQNNTNTIMLGTLKHRHTQPSSAAAETTTVARTRAMRTGNNNITQIVIVSDQHRI